MRVIALVWSQLEGTVLLHYLKIALCIFLFKLKSMYFQFLNAYCVCIRHILLPRSLVCSCRRSLFRRNGSISQVLFSCLPTALKSLPSSSFYHSFCVVQVPPHWKPSTSHQCSYHGEDSRPLVSKRPTDRNPQPGRFRTLSIRDFLAASTSYDLSVQRFCTQTSRSRHCQKTSPCNRLGSLEQDHIPNVSKDGRYLSVSRTPRPSDHTSFRRVGWSKYFSRGDSHCVSNTRNPRALCSE
jgi:hypothetical protein